MEWFVKIPTEVVYVFVAAIGGLARYLQGYLQEGEFSPRHLVAHVVVSAFSGYMFYQFAHSFEVFSSGMESVLAGMGGWMGVASLQFIEHFIKKKINK